MTDLRALLAPIKERVSRRESMIEDGSYQRQESRCADAETTLVSNGHPREVHWTTVKHPSYVSHLEALADKVPDLLAAIEAVVDLHEHRTGEYRDMHGQCWIGDYCVECRDEWPCDTVGELTAALGSDTTNQEGTQ